MFLTSDIWTTTYLHDFLAISVMTWSFFFKRETLVIGMVVMLGNYNAEHIKEAIESIANSFEFEKS